VFFGDRSQNFIYYKCYSRFLFTNIITVIKLKMRWVGHIAHMGEMGNMSRILVRKPERKKPRGRYRHRWKYNIEMEICSV
jgi:hypothetical protein